MSSKVLIDNGVIITQSMDEWDRLAVEYDLSFQEIGLIDFNRTGVVLNNNEVRVGFRTRFHGTILYENDISWFALPVRDALQSNFVINGSKIFFRGCQIGFVTAPVLDTCDTSYQRGEKLLNLNSRSRSNCAGCRACVHNDKSLYDDTVIRDRHELRTREEIKEFFYEKGSKGVNIAELEQIAVVTGLFRNEEDTIEHMRLVKEVASDYGFKGELMYFGCQIMTPGAIREFAELGNTAIVFAIDNFTNREKNLSKIKSNISLRDFFKSMQYARTCGVDTTFAYIAGVDDLSSMWQNFKVFADVCTRFPIVNIFQIQTNLQAQALAEEAKHLSYYLETRQIIEDVFYDTTMRPRRWENYRPLWYREFANEPLDVKPYG